MKKTAAIIFINEDGDILLQQRDEQAPVNPNEWGLFGGAVEGEESPEEAVRRETEEELGVTLKSIPLHFLGTYTYKNVGHGLTEMSVFYTTYDKNRKGELHEGKGLGFFNREEIRHLRTAPSVKDTTIVADLLERHKTNTHADLT